MDYAIVTWKKYFYSVKSFHLHNKIKEYFNLYVPLCKKNWNWNFSNFVPSCAIMNGWINPTIEKKEKYVSILVFFNFHFY